MSQPFCVDKLNPAGLISVRATLPIYLIDQVSSLQRRAERRDGKFKNEDQKYNCFYKIVYWINSLFSADENMYFSEKSTAGEYTKEGENVYPPCKIIYMKYLLILLGRMFLTLKHAVIDIYKFSVKIIF